MQRRSKTLESFIELHDNTQLRFFLNTCGARVSFRFFDTISSNRSQPFMLEDRGSFQARIVINDPKYIVISSCPWMVWLSYHAIKEVRAMANMSLQEDAKNTSPYALSLLIRSSLSKDIFLFCIWLQNGNVKGLFRRQRHWRRM